MIDKLQYLPLEEIEKDKLGFKEKAEEIANFINEFSPKLPYSLSINGSWGAGKSTMLNFIENNLDKGKCITVRFNPWMVSEHEELIKSLFEEIYYAMGEGNFQTAKDKFLKYAEKIVPSLTKAISFATAYLNGITPAAATTVANIAGDTVQGISNIAFDKPLSKRKQELNDAMEETVREDKRKIVIMIDELDRLFPEEVITIFQMIKSNLDLPGLFFVVAMDEEVVFDALTKKGVSKPEYYLQKIFQRKYIINTKYQLMTLTDNFIFNNFNIETTESQNALEECLKAYFYLQEEYFALNDSTENILFDRFRRKGWITVVKNDEQIKESYLEVFDALMSEVNLHNPRTFLNFKTSLLEHWSDYYNHIFKKELKMPFFIHAAFLIFLSHYIYPSFVEIKTFTRPIETQKDVPNFLKIISNHLSVIIPYFEELKSNSYDQQSKIQYPESMIHTAILYLYKFPDDVRILEM
ncbi:P-loop NTPase fold protein [Bacillus sp. JJ1127]|uniref:KAP family P-loop NTPase fold protein n=1 Tax=Bacillus sp. JJ1127 TaxID=3122952 RepID=UPI002FFFECCB